MPARKKSPSPAFAPVTDRDTFRALANVLRDSARKPRERMQALLALKTASFNPVAFAPYRSSYLAALRGLRLDHDPAIRQEAIGILCRAHDSSTQAMLVDDLASRAEAVLPAAKALQMLSYDPHSGAGAEARRIAANPPDANTRREALRVLAADPKSAPMFEQILRDRQEHEPIRKLAACALQQLAPRRLHACARDLTLDAGEQDDIRALGLTVLANFAGDDVLADAKLQKYVAALGQKGGTLATYASAAAQKLAERYV